MRGWRLIVPLAVAGVLAAAGVLAVTGALSLALVGCSSPLEASDPVDGYVALVDPRASATTVARYLNARTLSPAG